MTGGDSEAIGTSVKEPSLRPPGVWWFPWVLMRFVVVTLPTRSRGRYREEFSAELVDLPPKQQLVCGLHLLMSSGSLRRDLRPDPATVQRHGALFRIVVVAVLLPIVLAGFAGAARDARPGDTLWGLCKLLYADHARSVEGAETARRHLDEASMALAKGDYAEGQSMLKEAGHVLKVVAAEDGRAELETRHATLVTVTTGLVVLLEASPIGIGRR